MGNKDSKPSHGSCSKDFGQFTQHCDRKVKQLLKVTKLARGTASCLPPKRAGLSLYYLSFIILQFNESLCPEKLKG